MKRSLTAAEFRTLNSGRRNSRKNLLAKAEKQLRKQDKRERTPDPHEKNFPVDEPLTEGEKRMEEYYRERKGRV